jgi:hypothetical protein
VENVMAGLIQTKLIESDFKRLPGQGKLFGLAGISP